MENSLELGHHNEPSEVGYPPSSQAAPQITEVERQQLLVTWNQTAVEYPRDGSIHQIFQAQVERTPDAIALSLPSLTDDRAIQLTYRQLNDRANHLAHQLQALGVTTETFVAIALDRSIELMVAILGVLKAGGVYVPLDPAYPADRLAFMLADSQAPVLLTQSHLRDRLPTAEAQVICLDAGWGAEAPEGSMAPEVSVAAENLAYVNYTSGSTGRPKGVAIPHRAVLRLVFGASYTPLDGQQTLLQLAPISFDAATLEIWGALLHGGHCVLYPENGLPDPQDLQRILRGYGVTTMWLTAALFNAIVAEAPETLQGVREILTGGEALSVSHIRQAQAALPDTQFINGYGPTESTTFTCCYRIPRPLEDGCPSIPIGRPIGNTQVYVLDANLQPVAIGAAGELYIGGDGLARGYLNRPDWTTERFIPNPFSADPEAKLYKTGDLVRYRPDGNLEFIGRVDHQVKIRGYRIELGEIETVLSQQPGVREAIVIVREDRPGDKQLVAYVTAQPQHTLDPEALRAALRQQLADYMVPSAIVALDKIPLTPNGKADRKALPKPTNPSHDQQPHIAPTSAIEQTLTQLWGEILGLDRVGIEENFFDLGGTSILGLQLVARIQKQFNQPLRAVKLYQYPTIRALAQYLQQADRSVQDVKTRTQRQSDPNRTTALDGIAIVGMVGRFPGANSVEELWQNLCNGVESTTFFSPEEIDPSVDPELRDDPNYVRARGIVAGAETFDAAFFGISPREAEVMDPQARVFLELAYEALETVGYSPDRYDGLIGLYAGSGQNTYFERHLCGRPEIINRLGAFQTMLANEKDFVTTRTSYKLNLRGPSVSINTACSTSLVAVGHAVQGLLNHQCDLALAGGISITTPQNTGYLYQEGSMLSPDGRCRPFDAQAQGTMFNSGAGIVVLKRLAEALEDGDRIYAVIKGVGLNNDGADKVSFTAPSVHGQAEAIVRAHTMAGVDPDSITYVETHGTATPLGDPIEVEALTQAFRIQSDRQQFCGIGSIKSNIGHVVAAAGVAGLIKTALSLYHEQIPASLNYTAPNPQIDFDHSPFYVNAQLTPWPRGESPRRAGVSSFGVGGTNAHVVLEEAPIVQPSSPSRPHQLLLLSAKTSTALDRATENLRTYLEQHPEVNLADVAYTLQQGRKGWNHRRFVVCRDRESAISALTLSDTNRPATRSPNPQTPDVVFMFPGQGSQYLHMGANLYPQEPVFRSAIDRCAEILQPLLDRDLREVLGIMPGAASDEQEKDAAALLKQTIYTQPALFAIEYALAQLWMSWGVQPAALIGHSIGEFVAACIAGVFSLEDGLKLVATRGRLMWQLPPGSMLSVRLPAETIAPRLTGEMAIAAVNGPSLCVVSGPTEAVAKLQAELEAEEVICKPLHTSHAFHSPMMEPVIAPFADLIKGIPLSPPRIPFVSTVTTEWIRDEQATDPMYWASHLRETVRFAEGVQTLWQQPERVLLEVGPRTTATTLARQQAQDLKRQIAIASLGSSAEDGAEWASLMQAIGHLWLSGVTIDWSAFYADEYRHRVPLPTYPFERQRYWIDPKPAQENAAMLPGISAVPTPVQPQPAAPSPATVSTTLTTPEVLQTTMTEPRVKRLIPILQEVFEDTSGIEVGNEDLATSFLDLGMDSLTLTQVALAVQKKFKVKLTFRNLLEDYPSLASLSEHLDRNLSADAFPAPAAAPAAPVVSPPATPAVAMPVASTPVVSLPTPMTLSQPNGSIPAGSTPEQTRAIEAVIAQQLQLMAQQLQILNQTAGSTPIAQAPVITSSVPAPPAIAPVVETPALNGSQNGSTNGSVNGSTNGSTNGKLNASNAIQPTKTEDAKPQKSFGPGAKIEKSNNHALTPQQQAGLDRLMQRYISRTAESKRQAQEHRRYLADPRTVSGFTPLLKEIVYPIVTERSKGSKLWDVDGNEYVDLTNGFGLNFFGWSPDFVAEAVKAQMDKGIEIGPQTPLAGRVAKMVSEITGMERVAFCNTGSEAVMAAMRLSRTVTGRNTIAIFAGGYHGTFDEVVVRSGPKLRSLPAAPGIMPSMFENVLVLDYGTPESLQILRDRADDLAAIMVEPVQSRRPDLQPREFLKDLRVLTESSGTALIFDEVVTGFRVHPGGAQAYFDIRADLATYGKVIGGGLPIGVVAGKAEYMDALDGGYWQFGDASFPEVGVTFFAGTFVRHPMALAAAEVVLQRLQAAGPSLQQELAAKVDRFVKHLQQHFERVQAPIKIGHFSSFFYVTYAPEATYGSLLFYLLREKGVHIWEYRPCFFTLAHTDEDIEFVTRAFKDSVAELQAAGLLPGATPQATGDRNQPPQPGARLGRDPQGNPAWFVPDPERPGKYLQVGMV